MRLRQAVDVVEPAVVEQAVESAPADGRPRVEPTLDEIRAAIGEAEARLSAIRDEAEQAEQDRRELGTLDAQARLGLVDADVVDARRADVIARLDALREERERCEAEIAGLRRVGAETASRLAAARVAPLEARLSEIQRRRAELQAEDLRLAAEEATIEEPLDVERHAVIASRREFERHEGPGGPERQEAELVNAYAREGDVAGAPPWMRPLVRQRIAELRAREEAENQHQAALARATWPAGAGPYPG